MIERFLDICLQVALMHLEIWALIMFIAFLVVFLILNLVCIITTPSNKKRLAHLKTEHAKAQKQVDELTAQLRNQN